MPEQLDLTGQMFGPWKALEAVPYTDQKGYRWKCEGPCGHTVTRRIDHWKRTAEGKKYYCPICSQQRNVEKWAEKQKRKQAKIEQRMQRDAEKLLREKERIEQKAAQALKDPEEQRLHKNNQRKEYARKQRLAVLKFYGGNPPVCKCCGENQLEFLAVDHANNDGAAHRREVGKQTIPWIVRNGFPEGFQVLCHNCNMAKAIYGSCPHQARGLRPLAARAEHPGPGEDTPKS